jgi:hypothetical protein
MPSWMWAILLRPILAPIFLFVIVAPIAWFAYQLFPAGRLKVFLFRVRTGPNATRRDKWVMTVALMIAYAAYFTGLAILVLRNP